MLCSLKKTKSVKLGRASKIQLIPWYILQYISILYITLQLISLQRNTLQPISVQEPYYTYISLHKSSDIIFSWYIFQNDISHPCFKFLSAAQLSIFHPDTVTFLNTLYYASVYIMEFQSNMILIINLVWHS